MIRCDCPWSIHDPRHSSDCRLVRAGLISAGRYADVEPVNPLNADVDDTPQWFGGAKTN